MPIPKKPKMLRCSNPKCDAEILIPEGVKYLNHCPICFRRLNDDDLKNETQEKEGGSKTLEG